MNFARFCRLNASKFPEREFLIESYPSKKARRVLTWRDLEEQTNKVANYLIKECGIRKGDVVQHLLLNSLEWYVTYMAVLKTGAVVSPLNFRFASNDIKYACDVTRSKVFILGDIRAQGRADHERHGVLRALRGRRKHVACDHEGI
jgi:acyl-CoA synthetase (AMP-forming)/AMP-acid ligase II